VTSESRNRTPSVTLYRKKKLSSLWWSFFCQRITFQ